MVTLTDRIVHGLVDRGFHITLESADLYDFRYLPCGEVAQAQLNELALVDPYQYVVIVSVTVYL